MRCASDFSINSVENPGLSFMDRKVTLLTTFKQLSQLGVYSFYYTNNGTVVPESGNQVKLGIRTLKIRILRVRVSKHVRISRNPD